ncbi:phytanoyl-CoA dioxygenase family protein [Ovoidimarina sediminis]|uniref:phytanoyl-CoA dioxygenase family protein n=1 Tax=Ovoidimarina sediminis TaxID=3079856 RepID=UPI00290B40C2|nr:phytanoyl-CoA dioxygenase family protein [Rhodophyticola sp. MJ-SS7]MDU8942072.1 phytanoyl-CoA dioxygenase family protein [Rhodophyticola sp. MJ-SS7]
MLSRDQCDHFRRHGYLVIEDALDERVLEPLRSEYHGLMDRLYATWAAEATLPDAESFEEKLIAAYQAGFDWFQPMDISLPGDRIEADTPMHLGAAVFDLVTAPEILDIVEDIIGPEITSNPIQHVRIKPPSGMLAADEVRAHVGGTDWHQDRAVALQSADLTDMMTVWVAITDATIENGCLQVAPRLADKILPHCPYRQTAIARGFVDESAGVPLPVRAGGIVLIDPMLPHASLENRSDGIRWSFDLRYSRTGQPTGRDHFPDFIARSAESPGTELRDWQVWKIMWETARENLAATPHIDIHRWSSSSPVCA